MARYFEWLITCPVIIIALSNLTGLKDDYNWRTMKLLSANQGMLLIGATSALSTGFLNVFFFHVYSVTLIYISRFKCDTETPLKRESF